MYAFVFSVVSVGVESKTIHIIYCSIFHEWSCHKCPLESHKFDEIVNVCLGKYVHGQTISRVLKSYVCPTPFQVFSVIYPILRRMGGYTNDQQLRH